MAPSPSAWRRSSVNLSLLPYGFKAEAMSGMASRVLGEPDLRPSNTVPGSIAVREPFERLRRRAPPGDQNPLRFVSCGHFLPGHEVRIVDAEVVGR
jgi:hypothetical protein